MYNMHFKRMGMVKLPNVFFFPVDVLDTLKLIDKLLYRNRPTENLTTHNLIKKFSPGNKLHNNEYLCLAPHYLKNK